MNVSDTLLNNGAAENFLAIVDISIL